MLLNISAFTHAGMVRGDNQDHVLVNGRILGAGEINLFGEDHCICFVADGVGGNKAGGFASRYVLEGVMRAILDGQESDVEGALHDVNRELIRRSKGDQDLRGAATTLTGLMADDDTFQIHHAGDSQMWLRRNGSFFKVTNDQVLDDGEPNSPLTSYFGGIDESLRLDKDVFVREMTAGDTFLLCSDGLFKAFGSKGVRAVLCGGNSVVDQSRALLSGCLERGAEDNVSVILIERAE